MEVKEIKNETGKGEEPFQGGKSFPGLLDRITKALLSSVAMLVVVLVMVGVLVGVFMNMHAVEDGLVQLPMTWIVLLITVLLFMLVLYLLIRGRDIRLEIEKVHAMDENKAKREYLSNLSHDIRTPMNAIVGFTNLAIENEDNPLRVHNYLSKIHSSESYLISLINDVLDMSIIESGNVQIEESECSLTSLLEDLDLITSEQAEAKKQDLRFDMSDVADDQICCDSLRLSQILINLISNAIKFTPEGGMISVTLTQEWDAPEGFGSYEFRIKDDGPGMSKELAAHLFDLLECDHAMFDGEVRGSGMGMTITKKIIDIMDGTIVVDTEPGRGTEFILKLNFALLDGQSSRKKEDKDSGKDENVDFNNKRILLVDDNELNREIGVATLEIYGFVLETAVDGKDAFEKVKASEPGYYDAVLMDIMMPVMDGYESTKAIRRLENRELAKIPIIAMTANVFDEDRQNSIDAGMDGHLSKPIEVQKVIEALNEQFQK